MKEKRYFCDWYDDLLSSKWLYITLFTLSIISCIVTYNINKAEYGKEVADYSAYDYTYLTEIANSIYNSQNKSITSMNIPDNVEVSITSFSKEEIKITCTDDKNYIHVSNPTVYVTILDDFSSINIEKLAKESAVNNNSVPFTILFICQGLLIVFIPPVLSYFLLLPFYVFSYKKKRKNCTSN